MPAILIGIDPGIGAPAFSCVVRGVVEPKQSARFRQVPGAGIRSYQPAKVRNFAATLRAAFSGACDSCEPLDGPLALEMTFTLPRPASRPKRCAWPDRKPDLDNAGKQVLDSLEKAAVIVNDSRIVIDVRRKVYGEVPQIEVRLWRL